MAITTQCPFCHELLGPNDFLPGIGAVCPCCKQRIELSDLKQPLSGSVADHIATRSAVQAQPNESPLPPEDDEDLEEDSEEPIFQRRRPRPKRERRDPVPVLAFLSGCLGILLPSILRLPTSYKFGWVSKLLSLAGLLLALVCTLAPPLRRRTHVGFPLGVLALCALGLLFFGNWPKSTPVLPSPPVLISLDTNKMAQHAPYKDGDWVDASTTAVREHDVRIDLVSVTVGGVELETKEPEGKKYSRGPYLVIRLVVSYTGRSTAGLPYETWADLPGKPSKHQPRLTDNKDQASAQVTLDAGLKPALRSGDPHISPDDQVTEVLIFSPPLEEVEYLHLELPASAFGLAGNFRFHIPKSMIRAAESALKP